MAKKDLTILKDGFTLPLLVIFLTALIFISGCSSAEAYIKVILDGKHLSGTQYDAAMLACIKNPDRTGISTSIGNGSQIYIINMSRGKIPQLDIKEYDSERDFYWVPTALERCEVSECKYVAPYERTLPREFKLAVFIPEKNETYISNAVPRTRPKSTYTLKLSTDGTAKISETPPFFSENYLKSFFAHMWSSLVIKLGVALAFFWSLKFLKKFYTAVIVSFVSLFLLLLFGHYLINVFWLFFLVLPICIIVYEAFVLHHWNKEKLDLKKAFLLSVLMNLIPSFFSGLAILAFFLGLW